MIRIYRVNVITYTPSTSHTINLFTLSKLIDAPYRYAFSTLNFSFSHPAKLDANNLPTPRNSAKSLNTVKTIFYDISPFETKSKLSLSLSLPNYPQIYQSPINRNRLILFLLASHSQDSNTLLALMENVKRTNTSWRMNLSSDLSNISTATPQTSSIIFHVRTFVSPRKIPIRFSFFKNRIEDVASNGEGRSERTNLSPVWGSRDKLNCRS